MAVSEPKAEVVTLDMLDALEELTYGRDPESYGLIEDIERGAVEVDSEDEE
jgi:ferritin-like protein